MSCTLTDKIPSSVLQASGLNDTLDKIGVSQLEEQLKQKPIGSELDKRSVECIRGLVLDCCQQWGIGHGGSALGMAAIATALWRHKLRFDPSCPDWFDRDRFVLSNGHVGLLQYIMLHLSGYEQWTMDQLKAYCHPTALNFTNICKTHPEIEFDGLDMSTGPLGQGVANAVGMAIANKHLRQKFNRDGWEIIQSKVYATTGDACIQEGPALEAISLAGRLQLDNLILIYDNNGVQSDGPITLTFTENVNDKMRACGWYVLEVPDGNNNVQAIVTALEHADNHVGQPIFLNIKTTIGLGTSIAGTCKAHHAAFGPDNVRECKESWGYDANATHIIPDDVAEYWRDVASKGQHARDQWSKTVARYGHCHPELGNQLHALMDGREASRRTRELLMNLEAPTGKVPVRQSSAQVFDALWSKLPMMGGSADLSEPNFVLRVAKEAFGPLEEGPAAVRHQSYNGRFIHFGTREHAMAAISNGIAAYSFDAHSHSQAIVPVTATFAMFQLYAAPAIRMGALMRLKVVHLGTHDSIAEGACGPTHQPVEMINLWRSMPELLYIRPGDAEEAIGAWIMALEHEGPTVLGLSRGGVPLQTGTSRTRMLKGAYVIADPTSDQGEAKVTLISTGSDLANTVDAATILNEQGIPTRVVSMPSMRRFEEQSAEYMTSVIPRDGRPVVSVEAMSMHGWARWATASIGLKTFGTTVHADAVADHFRISPKHIARRVKAYLKDLGDANALTQMWRAI